MDFFQHAIHVERINSLTTALTLIREMSIYSNPSYPSIMIRTKHGVLPNINSTRLKKSHIILSLFHFDLYCVARRRYIELGFILTKLPMYAQVSPITINLQQSIKDLS